MNKAKMETKDTWLIIIAILGWGWGVVQFFINRRNQKRDKDIERRFEVYTAYMKKADELMQNLRADPNMIFGFSTEFLKVMLNGNEDEIHEALLKFNSQLFDFIKKAAQPLLILNQELSTLLLVCSDQLTPKIQEYKHLTIDYNNELQNILKTVSLTNPQEMADTLNTIGHNKRWTRIGELNEEILSLMRKELSYR